MSYIDKNGNPVDEYGNPIRDKDTVPAGTAPTWWREDLYGPYTPYPKDAPNSTQAQNWDYIRRDEYIDANNGAYQAADGQYYVAGASGKPLWSPASFNRSGQKTDPGGSIILDNYHAYNSGSSSTDQNSSSGKSTPGGSGSGDVPASGGSAYVGASGGYTQGGGPTSQFAGSNSPGVLESTDPRNNYEVGGISAINPQADPMDYNQINQFSDAAYENARRWMDPQMQAEDARFAQELINKGIDPYSEQGRKAFMMKERSQNDMQSAQQFNAMKFGTDIQQQMYGQDLARSGLANALLGKKWDLGENARQYDSSLTNNAYQYDTSLAENARQFDEALKQGAFQFNTTSGMAANQMDFNQMMGLEGLDYRDYLTNVDQQRYNDSLVAALMGMAPGATPGSQGQNSLGAALIAQYGADSDIYNAWLATQQG